MELSGLRTIKDIATFLKSNGEKLNPLSAYKIQDLEKRIQHPLPEVYKEFLLAMGNGAGGFMRGSFVFYPDIFLLQEGTNELILEHDLDPLPANAFVFWNHQGYQAAYFLLDESDDPAVYVFIEGNGSKEFHRREESLINFFLIQLKMSGYT